MTGGCSVVVVTSGRRPSWLHRCMDALRAQASPTDEILCVSLVPDPVLSADARVRFVHEPRHGVSLAKNVGWRLSTRPIVAFTDDDCVPSPRWIRTIEAAFLEGAEDGITGRVVPAGAGAWHASSPDTLEPRTFRSMTDVRWPWEPGAGNNMAFRRIVLDALGGFDERLGPGSHFLSAEDLDLFLRLLTARRSLVFHPEIQVLHEPLRDSPAIEQSLHAYRFGLGALFAKFRQDLPAGVPEFLLERDGREFLRAVRRGDVPSALLRTRAMASLLRGFRAWTETQEGG